MEERLRHRLERLRKNGSPDFVKERLLLLLGDGIETGIHSSEYHLARSQGLSINEAELALSIYQGLQKLGYEDFTATIGSCQTKSKRKRRKTKDDGELKKKAKL